MAITAGTAVNFAFTAPGFTETTTTQLTGKFILQSVDVSRTSDEEQVRNAAGSLVTRSFYNPAKKATLEYVCTGADIATAKTNTTVPTIGALIYISAAAEMPLLVNSTASDRWVVVAEPVVRGSNSTSARVTLMLEEHTNIQALAS